MILNKNLSEYTERNSPSYKQAEKHRSVHIPNQRIALTAVHLDAAKRF